MSVWAQILNKILSILEQLPGLLGAMGFGYKIGKAESKELKKKLNESELEKDYLKNERDVEIDSRDPNFVQRVLERLRSKMGPK